ncbi:MAG TPA: DUF559 domain-containing protein [Thermoanaerobaculia bacterium]|nr:DUF559 domain-containing protein [Thermoanaerobaculia bacterium]
MSYTTLARALRRSMTDTERFLWSKLRYGCLGHKFRRQVPVGPYIVDFACLARKLVIEVDGGQHCESAEDKARDQWLQGEGYMVLRFWNHEVLGNVEGVLERVLEMLRSTAGKKPPT